MSTTRSKQKRNSSTKQSHHPLLADYDMLVELLSNREHLGGITWKIHTSPAFMRDEKRTVNEVKSLVQKHIYKQPLYPATSEKLMATSIVSFNFINQLKETMPKKSAFLYDGKVLRYDAYQHINLSFRLQKVDNKYRFSQIVKYRGLRINTSIHPFKDYGALIEKNNFYLWHTVDDMNWFIKTLPMHGKKFDNKHMKEIYDKYILTLTRHYTVHIDSSFIQEYIKGEKPRPVLTLFSSANTIKFALRFLYGTIEVIPPCMDRYYVPNDTFSMFYQIDRNAKEENQWMEKLSLLHSDAEQTDSFKWHIPKKSFTKSWSNSFFDTLESQNVLIREENFIREKSRVYIPTVKIKLYKGHSWFDADVQVKIEGKVIPISYLQDAILSNEKEVHVNEDTYLLSKDWLRKYRNIFMWGKMKGGKLRFSNYQDYLFDTILSAKELSILSKRSAKLTKKILPPKSLRNILRSYQKEGFQWMNILQQTGKGGILADDMGLGKTIQTLAQLLMYYKTYGRLSALIVCPASIINNWKEEIEKFTPELKFITYHSQQREISSDGIANHQIIITSYNILQRDLNILQKIYFDYIVLDESQYIKNSYNKTSQCAFKLSSKHRLCLSGTPLQNHTFDIYSQIHFLNPGTFGTIENFKSRFAVLIDQYEEKETEKELKKLLSPFILRRTKKQVAKDLPDKSESVLYCTMQDAQREIYEYYRERNRNYLLDKLQKEGLMKSKFHVLQGLTFLRQICNSPVLVKQEIEYNETPIKLKILQERLIEKEDENKALIFSQFIGMLSIIKRHVKKDGWDYAYFDGKTALKKRTSEIERFQTDPLCKLFLISIKAGSVGLNLTAADYVYLIDPWWNPAVEQQAIDRTHRIGQSKNIFAYKFICKDTIEEKIMKLQSKKAALADSLIMINEQSFVRSLSTDDIEYLFS